MRNSIYISKNPTEFRADLLLEYNKKYDEIWRIVPHTEQRYIDLKTFANNFEKPGLFDIISYFDVLGSPYSLFRDGKLFTKVKASHNLAFFSFYIPSYSGNYVYSEFMECITKFIKGLEDIYGGSVWVLNIEKHSDVINIQLCFNDDFEIDSALSDPNKLMPGNNIKFLCYCGQFRNKKRFLSELFFTKKTNGYVGAGFYYNDIEYNCEYIVSKGNNKFFKNIRGDIILKKSSAYSYYARAWNIDNAKLTWFNKSGTVNLLAVYNKNNSFYSIEEFKLLREIAGGLKLGDSCILLDPSTLITDSDVIVDPIYVCWDGSKWVNYYTEVEIK